MSYRIETALSGRAVCRATECQKHKVKIDKDELRMGTWVEYKETGSWHWKHWGCVSGFQIQKIRNNLEDPGNPGTYRWDFLDGYEGEEPNSLDKHPELQEKVRRVITQGFIDPEDFNGDPEMNKLGEKGLHTTESKRRMRQDQINRAQELEDLQAQVAALTAERGGASEDEEFSGKANVKVEAEEDGVNNTGTKAKSRSKKAVKDESPSQKTTKRKRTSRLTKNEEEDEEVYDVKPAKRSRSKKGKAKEESDMVKEESDYAPVSSPAPEKRTGRGTKVVKEESSDFETNLSKPKRQAKKPKNKPVVKDEPCEEESKINQISEHRDARSTDPSKKRKAKVRKSEISEASPVNLAGNVPISVEAPSGAVSSSTAENYILGVKDSDLQFEFEKAVDAGEIEDDFDAYIEKRKGSLQRKKKGRRMSKS